METKLIEPKQVIVINKELDMPNGKLAAQCAHMSNAFIFHKLHTGKNKVRETEQNKYVLELELDEPTMLWATNSFVKVVLAAKNENDLLKLVERAKSFGLKEEEDFFRIIDEGRTVFDGKPTWTGIGFKPMFPEDIDPVVKRYQLYK